MVTTKQYDNNMEILEVANIVRQYLSHWWNDNSAQDCQMISKRQMMSSYKSPVSRFRFQLTQFWVTHS